MDFGTLISAFNAYIGMRHDLDITHLTSSHQVNVQQEQVILRTNNSTWLEPICIDDFLQIMAFTLGAGFTDGYGGIRDECRNRSLASQEDLAERISNYEFHMQHMQERVGIQDQKIHDAEKIMKTSFTQQVSPLHVGSSGINKVLGKSLCCSQGKPGGNTVQHYQSHHEGAADK